MRIALARLAVGENAAVSLPVLEIAARRQTGQPAHAGFRAVVEEMVDAVVEDDTGLAGAHGVAAIRALSVLEPSTGIFGVQPHLGYRSAVTVFRRAGWDSSPGHISSFMTSRKDRTTAALCEHHLVEELAGKKVRAG